VEQSGIRKNRKKRGERRADEQMPEGPLEAATRTSQVQKGGGVWTVHHQKRSKAGRQGVGDVVVRRLEKPVQNMAVTPGNLEWGRYRKSSVIH